jgi:PPOX class probable F420-dependent enzyme
MHLSAAHVAFLDNHPVARLATLSADGYPHVVPICFAYMDGAIYTPIDEKPKRAPAASLRRVRNILARAEVCVVWDHYEEAWERLAWLQVRGHAALVEDPAERARAVIALRQRYPQYRRMDLESRPLIKITPARVRWWSATPVASEDS